MLRARAEHVTILNRTPDRAEALRNRLDPRRRSTSVVSAHDDLTGRSFDLVVNATSLGLHPGDPFPSTGGARVGAALDLVYSPGETAWVHRMRAEGARAADGKEMLLYQGAAAFRRWTGREPPVEAMRAALALPG